MKRSRARLPVIIGGLLFLILNIVFKDSIEAALSPLFDGIRDCAHHLVGQTQHSCSILSSASPQLAKTYTGQDKNTSQEARGSNITLSVNSQEQGTINVTITYHIDNKDYQYSCNSGHITSDRHITNFTCTNLNQNASLGLQFDFKNGLIQPDGNITGNIDWSDGRDYSVILTPNTDST